MSVTKSPNLQYENQSIKINIFYVTDKNSVSPVKWEGEGFYRYTTTFGFTKLDEEDLQEIKGMVQHFLAFLDEKKEK